MLDTELDWVKLIPGFCVRRSATDRAQHFERREPQRRGHHPTAGPPRRVQRSLRFLPVQQHSAGRQIRHRRPPPGTVRQPSFNPLGSSFSQCSNRFFRFLSSSAWSCSFSFECFNTVLYNTILLFCSRIWNPSDLAGVSCMSDPIVPSFTEFWNWDWRQGAGGGLGRAPRQRHPAHVRRGSARPLRFASPARPVSHADRRGRLQRRRPGSRRWLHRQHRLAQSTFRQLTETCIISCNEQKRIMRRPDAVDWTELLFRF